MYKTKLSKAIKYLLISALVLLCALLIWALMLYVLGLEVQWWIKAIILTCVAAALVITFLLRKLWLKRRERKFVDGIIGMDKMPGSISALDDASRELRKRFKEAVSTLKKSHLKGHGNPLYVLPWYLIVGKSGSGKSTAIKSARLPSPFGDINRISGIEGTRNCDWWFFDESVVIDIAGRYSVHRNPDLDKGEWLAFLQHLVKYRKKEPINGVIVTAEADQLLEFDLEKIEEEGRTIRKRIEEVINVMGAKFPIYLLVTKCDLIYGMNRYYQLLSKQSLEQAMGLMNHDTDTNITSFVNKTIDTLVDKLKDIRLILANMDEVQDRHYVEPEVLLFPDEFARLRTGLTAFCKGAFKDNPFQELAVVRGIYFCSGQQFGRPVPCQAERVSKISSMELPGTGNGFFLYDLFAKILPADRPLHSLTRSAREWYRLTHNLWLTGFVTLALIGSILLTHSWNENKAAINIVSPKYKKAILFQNDPIIDIGIMDEFGHQIKEIEQRNQSWNFPRLGLAASLKLEKSLKKRYCERFYEHFDADVNIKIESQIANGGWHQNEYKPAAQYLPFITRRINLIKAKFNGADANQLLKMPDPDYTLMAHGHDKTVALSDVMEGYKNAYINYLVWQDDVEVLNKTLVGMQRFLKNFFHDSQGNLNWLVSWVNTQLDDKSITLNSYWKSNTDDTHFVKVAPAFTMVGKKLIGRFVIHELVNAVEQPLWIAKPKDQFAVWYKDEYYTAWMNFCRNFCQAKRLFNQEETWKSAVASLAGEDSPYLNLLDTIVKELFPLGDSQWPTLKTAAEEDPMRQQWLDHIRIFGIIRQASAGDAVTDNKETQRLANRLPSKARIVAKIATGALDDTRLGKGKNAYAQYRQALEKFAGISASSSHAYEIAKAGFEDDPAEAKSAVYAAQRAIDQLKAVLSKDMTPDKSEQTHPFWCLITEPVDEMWRFSVDQAGRHLQKLWDQTVIVQTEGIYERHRLVSLLFGDKGCAQKFINTTAAPFVGRDSRRGYYARELRGCAVPFKKSFFGFAKQGQRWGAVTGGHSRSYSVDIMAYPTDVNIEARVKPHLTRLALESTEGTTILENRQYPIENKFTWSPSKSGDVLLEILLGDITLTRKYTGYYAFGKFLREFSKGKRKFTINDFPEYSAEFHRLGVKEIDVSYQLQSEQIRPIMRLMNTAPGRPPAKIIS